jgi:hypothetical protein
MNQRDAERRIEALESTSRYVDHRPLAEAAATRFGFHVDELIAEAELIARRVEEIGIVAVQAEQDAETARVAERCGVSAEQLASDVDAFFAGYKPATS